ncbi:MAG: hypothetical protein ACM3N0_07675 [Chloroflexota bacterium]
MHATDVDAEAAARTAAEIGGGAQSAALDPCATSQPAGRSRAEVARDGSLDLWVNNAGVLVTGSSWEQDEERRSGG